MRVVFDGYLLVHFNNTLNSWNITEISYRTSENTRAVISSDPIKGVLKVSEKVLCSCSVSLNY